MKSYVHLAVFQDAIWICPVGEIDSSNVLLLEDAFWLAKSYACSQTLVDFSKLQFISSAGLGQIIHAIGELRDAGSRLEMGGINESVYMALMSIGIDRFVKLADLPYMDESRTEVSGIIIPGDLGELRTVRSFLEESFKRIRYDDISSYGLKMAVDELVSNVIRHNYNGVTGKPVTVLLSRKDDLLEASIIDQGYAFDPTTFQGREFGETILGGHSGGMGINLVRTLSDSFEYKNEQGHNIAQLRKNLA